MNRLRTFLAALLLIALSLFVRRLHGTTTSAESPQPRLEVGAAVTVPHPAVPQSLQAAVP